MLSRSHNGQGPVLVRDYAYPYIGPTTRIVFDDFELSDAQYSVASSEANAYFKQVFRDTERPDAIGRHPLASPSVYNPEGDDADGARTKAGPLLRLLRALEAQENLGNNVQTLVITSKCEHMDKVSYWIDPELLGKVLNKLDNLQTLSVGQLGVECARFYASGRESAFKLKTLEARWEDLLPTPIDDHTNPGLRRDTSSFCDLMAMFSDIGELRFAYSTSFWTSSSLSRCVKEHLYLLDPRPRLNTHVLATVHSVHLVPPSGPIPSTARAILRFLASTLEPLAIQELVVNDLCQVAVQEINQLVLLATNLSRVSLNFQLPMKRRDIQLGNIDLSGSTMLRNIDLSILLRPNPDPQPEWEKVIEILRSASQTPVECITLRIAARLVPPEDANELAWNCRLLEAVEEEFHYARWPQCDWMTILRIVQGSFGRLRSLRVQCSGPAHWMENEGAAAMEVLWECLSLRCIRFDFDPISTDLA